MKGTGTSTSVMILNGLYNKDLDTSVFFFLFNESMCLRFLKDNASYSQYLTRLALK